MSDILIVNYKKLHPEAKLTQAHTYGDVGFDLYAVDYVRTSHYIEYRTGIAVEFPEGYFGLLIPRSSLSEYNLFLGNSMGVIDNSYRGELKFRYKLYPFEIDVNRPNRITEFHDTFDLKILNVGDKCGQLVILPYPSIHFVEVNELSDTIRGNKGFGSSGK